MKRIQLLTLLAVLCLTACTEPTDKVIDRPAFKSMTNADLLPVKVEQSKEATMVLSILSLTTTPVLVFLLFLVSMSMTIFYLLRSL